MTNRSTDRELIPERSKVKAIYDKQLASHLATMQQLAQDVRLILEQHGLTPAVPVRMRTVSGSSICRRTSATR